MVALVLLMPSVMLHVLLDINVLQVQLHQVQQTVKYLRAVVLGTTVLVDPITVV